MTNAHALNERVPGDPTGSALGIGLLGSDIDEILRPGLRLVGEMMPRLASKADEVLAEVDSPDNPLRESDRRLIMINRLVSASDLERGEVVVLDCDARKVLALIVALQAQQSPRARELRDVVISAIVNGGIPLRIEGEPRIGGSIFFRIFDDSIEMTFARRN